MKNFQNGDRVKILQGLAKGTTGTVKRSRHGKVEIALDGAIIVLDEGTRVLMRPEAIEIEAEA